MTIQQDQQQVPLDDVKGWVELLRHVKTKRAELDEVEAKAREQIQTALGNAEIGTVDGQVALTWKWSKPARRFDQATFKAEHPDLAAQYTVLGDPVRRLILVDPA